MTAHQQWWFTQPIYGVGPTTPDTPTTYGWSQTLRGAGVALTYAFHSTFSFLGNSAGQVVSEVTHTDDGDYYAEVTIVRDSEWNGVTSLHQMMIGLSGYGSPNLYPGHEADEFVIYANNGQKYTANGGSAYASQLQVGDVIGIRFNNGVLSFSVNGVDKGVAFSGITGDMHLAWGVGTSAKGYRGVFLNVGQFAFQYAPVGITGWERTPEVGDPEPEAPYFIMNFLHCIVRPDADGDWYIQDDSDHAPSGILSLTQESDGLLLSFDQSYPKAGAITVTSDDDFSGRVEGHSSLGLSSARIRVTYPTEPGVYQNPSDVFVDNPGITPASGNFWVQIVMP